MGEFKSKYNKKEEIQLKAKLSDLAWLRRHIKKNKKGGSGGILRKFVKL